MDVLPSHKRLNDTSEAVYGYRPPGVDDGYVKTDHCQYVAGHFRLSTYPTSACVDGVPTPAHEATCFAIPPEGQRNSLNQTTEEALGACQARCSRSRGWCTASRPR